jgi:act minimal PKS acyl carrier protein
MHEFTLADLNKIMRESGGNDGPSHLDDDAAQATFSDLGYDSLAVLEIAARIGQDFPVYLSDDDVGQLATPRDTVMVVNKLLADGA